MYQSLQACRAVAAILVVLFHLGGTFAQDRYFGFKAIDGPFAWGDAGVEFFFVLSGFLIAMVHRKDIGRPQQLGGYLRKRALRIYPTYWLVCALVFLAALAAPSLQGALPHEAGVLVKALALIPQDPAVVGGLGAPILFVAWSLQYEMMFYAVMAVFILSRSAGLVLVAGGVALGLGCRFGEACSDFPLNFVTSNLTLLFAMGVACAWLVRSRMRLPMPVATAAIAALAFVAYGAFEVSHGRDASPLDRRLVYGAIASVLLLALAQAEDAGRLKWMGRPWIALLGDSSYALYLLHIPIISLLCKLLMKFEPRSPILLTAMFAAVALGCMASAVFFHTRIERPMLAWLRPRTTPKPASGVQLQDAH